MNRSELEVRFFMVLGSDNAFSGHACSVFVCFVTSYAQNHIITPLNCKKKMQEYRFTPILSQAMSERGNRPN